MAVRADTGELLHIRNRKRKANTQRGVSLFVYELLSLLRLASHSYPFIILAYSSFENHKLFNTLTERVI